MECGLYSIISAFGTMYVGIPNTENGALSGNGIDRERAIELCRAVNALEA